MIIRGTESFIFKVTIMNIEIESPGLYTFSQYLSMYDLKKLHDPVLLITKVPYLLVQQDPVNTKSMCFSI